MSTSKRVKIILKVNPTTTSISTQCSSTSAYVVANNDELLTQILLLLPIKSLLKFKSVSKHWLSLISNPEFSHLRIPFPNSTSGLFLRDFSSFNNNPRYNFIDYKPKPNAIPSRGPFEYLAFANDPLGIRILQSCHGLILCSSSLANPRKTHYYVYNPTTKQYSLLPPLRFSNGHVIGVSLAFDPSKSPHYKAVCVRRNRRCGFTYSSHCYQIEIYSSDKGPWRVSSCSFTASADTEFHRGVFCNRAIHWFSSLGNCLYFNVDEEQVRDLPMPPIPDNWGQRRMKYFGESRDHLHLTETYGPKTLEFNVYEMGRDYSCWIVKYLIVDLNAVPVAFPKMIRNDLQPRDLNYYGFSILVVQAEVDENSYFVLNIPGIAVRYNFQDKSFYKLCDIADTKEHVGSESSIMLDCSQAYQYIESLSCV